MIISIEQHDDKTTIYVTNSKTIEIQKSIEIVLRELCFRNLFSLEGYIKSLRLIFPKTKKIPLYINKLLILIPIHPKKVGKQIYINYFALKKYETTQKGVLIHLVDEKIYRYFQSADSFSSLLEKAKDLIIYKDELSCYDI